MNSHLIARVVGAAAFSLLSSTGCATAGEESVDTGSAAISAHYLIEGVFPDLPCGGPDHVLDDVVGWVKGTESRDSTFEENCVPLSELSPKWRKVAGSKQSIVSTFKMLIHEVEWDDNHVSFRAYRQTTKEEGLASCRVDEFRPVVMNIDRFKGTIVGTRCVDGHLYFDLVKPPRQ
jgi:hypothetical protein